jgi:hypothetical protein
VLPVFVDVVLLSVLQYEIRRGSCGMVKHPTHLNVVVIRKITEMKLLFLT